MTKQTAKAIFFILWAFLLDSCVSSKGKSDGKDQKYETGNVSCSPEGEVTLSDKSTLKLTFKKAVATRKAWKKGGAVGTEMVLGEKGDFASPFEEFKGIVIGFANKPNADVVYDISAIDGSIRETYADDEIPETMMFAQLMPDFEGLGGRIHVFSPANGNGDPLGIQFKLKTLSGDLIEGRVIACLTDESAPKKTP